jgi:hypothetical protein
MGANEYWQLRQYSLVLAKAGKVSEAIAAAKESLAKAQTAKNNDYVKMNEDSIKEWMGDEKINISRFRFIKRADLYDRPFSFEIRSMDDVDQFWLFK